MKIFILSLPKDADRRAHMIEQLSKAGILDYEFVDGVDCRGKAEEELEGIFNLRRFKTIHSVYPTAGEIGCALGHYKIWRRCLESGDNGPWLIMEDDLTIHPGFYEKLDALKKWMRNSEKPIGLTFCYFCVYHSFKTIAEIKMAEDVDAAGAYCYTLNRRAVEALIELGAPHYLADDWKYFRKFMKVFVAMDATVSHDGIFASNIERSVVFDSDDKSLKSKIQVIAHILPRILLYKVGYYKVFQADKNLHLTGVMRMALKRRLNNLLKKFCGIRKKS